MNAIRVDVVELLEVLLHEAETIHGSSQERRRTLRAAVAAVRDARRDLRAISHCNENKPQIMTKAQAASLAVSACEKLSGERTVFVQEVPA